MFQTPVACETSALMEQEPVAETVETAVQHADTEIGTDPVNDGTAGIRRPG